MCAVHETDYCVLSDLGLVALFCTHAPARRVKLFGHHTQEFGLVFRAVAVG